MNKLTHLDETGAARMVDVGAKAVSRRTARAGGHIGMSAAAFALLDGGGKKGDVLATARLAAIMAAKRTAEVIPLCHVLPLESVKVEFERDAAGGDAGDAIAPLLRCVVSVAATAKTGVEMEAIIGVQACLATVYDMLKAVDRAMVISNVRLLEKRGGTRGDYVADTPLDAR